MTNLISIDDLNDIQLFSIVEKAKFFFNNNILKHHNDIENANNIANGKILINLFFENSTRTKTSFQIAAHNLGYKVVNIDLNSSSIKKGESIIDTIKTINAMNPNVVVVRHNSSGFAHFVSQYLDCLVINAGDGTNEHPTQSLVDLTNISLHKSDLHNLKIAICGDVFHSRVAHSNIKLLHRLSSKFALKINIASPATLLNDNYQKWLDEKYQIKSFANMVPAIENADCIMLLRIQQERMSSCYISSHNEYFKYFGLDESKIKLAKSDVIIMHPGPINRDVEIASNLADNLKYSTILDQVALGVATRQAILTILAN